MPSEVINFARKFALLSEQWQPRVVAELNDYQFKVVRLEGDFVWHDHPETDEVCIVLDGELRIDFRDRFRRAGAGRDVRRSQGHRTQAVRRKGGQDAADRTARHPSIPVTKAANVRRKTTSGSDFAGPRASRPASSSSVRCHEGAWRPAVRQDMS